MGVVVFGVIIGVQIICCRVGDLLLVELNGYMYGVGVQLGVVVVIIV